MYEGAIFSVGTPLQVLTRENIRTVYGVDSDIIDDGGRPHLVLKDLECDECRPMPDGSVCTSDL